ncbi:MAG: hypothetical protein ACLFQH_04455 [Halothiobacillaceae bacterium]
MTQVEIISERYPHKVSAVFNNGPRARDAASALTDKIGLSWDQVELVAPDDPKLSKKLEPESGRIFRTLLFSHLWLGIAGLVAGLILAGVLVGMGFDFATTRPMWVFIIAGGFGIVGGMLLAGLVSARPDHEPVILKAENASDKGNWTVVAHARDEAEKHRADELLEHYSKDVTDTL